MDLLSRDEFFSNKCLLLYQRFFSLSTHTATPKHHRKWDQQMLVLPAAFLILGQKYRPNLESQTLPGPDRKVQLCGPATSFPFHGKLHTLSCNTRKPGARRRRARLGYTVNNFFMYVYIICMIGNTNYTSNLRVVVDYRFQSSTSCNNAWYIFWALRCCYATI